VFGGLHISVGDETVASQLIRAFPGNTHTHTHTQRDSKYR
jgi:hypothetical protein